MSLVTSWLSAGIRAWNRRGLLDACAANPGGGDIDGLRECLRRAQRDVPAYRTRLAAIDVDAITDLDAFAAQVPLLDKSAVRANPDAFLSVNAQTPLRTVRTGGSTGMPMRFFMDEDAVWRQKGAMCRGRRWWGLPPNADRYVLVWGRGASFAPGWRGRFQRIKMHTKDWLLGRERWSAYDLKRDRLAEMLDRMHRARPDFIEGYASALDLIATWILERGDWRPPASLRLAVCTAEPLHEAQRARIAQAFGVPVANEYGCTEIGVLGYSCPDCGRVHLFTDQVHVEFPNRYREQTADGPGNERGEVVVTSFRHHSAPLIRYRLGDDAELADDDGDCPRGPTRVLSIRGRTHDRVRTRDGRIVHGQFFTHVMAHTPGVVRFQVVQESFARVVVRIEPAPDWKPQAAARIRDLIQAQLGPDTEVSVQTGGIEREVSGKYRWVISRLDDAPSHDD